MATGEQGSASARRRGRSSGGEQDPAPARRRVRLTRNEEPELASDGPVMPGEVQPLRWTAGRGPVTPDEVLANMRRRTRLANLRKDSPPVALPDALPDPDTKKIQLGLRLPELLNEYIHLIALLEDIPWAAAIEFALMEKALSAPLDPKVAEERFRRMEKQLRSGDVDLDVLSAKLDEMVRVVAELRSRDRPGKG